MNPNFSNKLIIGIDENPILQPLLSKGIRQFFVGFVPSFWSESFGYQKSPNRRNNKNEQITSSETLLSITESIHQRDGKIYIALNTPYVTNMTMPHLKRLADDLMRIECDGTIVATIELLEYFRISNYKKIVVSNSFGTYTKEDIDFLIERYAPIKIVLPRDMSLLEIEDIVTSYPDMAFEVFLFGDHCRFSDANCFVEHGYKTPIDDVLLCSFTQGKKRYFSKERADFKSLIQNGETKKLKIQYYDLESAIKALEKAKSENDLEGYESGINILKKIDRDSYLTEELYHRLSLLLRGSEEEMLIKDTRIKNSEALKIYHRANSAAIQKSVEFFSRFPNITSYKIPSRGRNIMNFLDIMGRDEEYIKKESAYNL